MAALWEKPFHKAPSYWGGVSLKGRQLINEMNRIGMIVDLSHVSVDTMLDVLGGREEKWAGSKAPVMFSHSSAYAHVSASAQRARPCPRACEEAEFNRNG